jgi:hypothetical protein
MQRAGINPAYTENRVVEYLPEMLIPIVFFTSIVLFLFTSLVEEF